MPYHALQTLLLTDMKTSLDSLDGDRNRGDYYHQKMRTVFTAPATGAYKFYLSSDDDVDVYVSELEVDTASSSTKVIDFDGYCVDLFPRTALNSGGCDSSSMSSEISMVAGKDYVIELHHREWSGWDYVGLGILVPNSEPSYNSIREIELLDISATVTYEKQKVDIPLTSQVASGIYTLYWTYTVDGFPTFSEARMNPLNHTTTYLTEQLSFMGDIEVTLCTSSTTNGLCFEVEMKTLVPDQRSLLEVRYAAEMLTCASTCGLAYNTILYATRLQDGDPSVTGTFAISYGPLITGNIAWGASESTVREALEAVDGFPGSRFFVKQTTYSASQLTYDVEMIDFKAPMPFPLQINVDGLSGPASIVGNTTVLQTGSYDKLLTPIPSYMLSTVETKPQVRVTSNGHLSSCNATDAATGLVGSCPFVSSESLTPVITSVEEYLGPDSASDPATARVLVISGRGFSSDLNGNLITVAGEVCAAMAAEETSVTCALTTVVTGTNNIVMTVLDKGLARHEGNLAPYFVVGPLTVTSVTPTLGSVGGGTFVTITGGVFPVRDPSLVVITFEEALNSGETGSIVVPALESMTEDTIVFKSPANSELKAEYDNVKVEIAGFSHEFAFGYDASLSPLITSVTPQLVSAVEPTLLTITGQDLGTSSSQVEITLAGDPCVVRTISDTETTCMWYPMDNTQLINCDVQCERLIDGVPRTNHDIVYNYKSKGIAVGVPGSLSVRVALEINSVVPDHGSIFGGTMVTIRGSGFGTGDNFPTTVSVGTDYPASACDVIFINLTYIECSTRQVAQDDQGMYQDVEATIRNVPTECNYIPYVPPGNEFYGLDAAEGVLGETGSALETPDAGPFYGLVSGEISEPASPPPPGVVSLGTLSDVAPPPPYPPSPPQYPSKYNTVTYYGIGDVLVEFPRSGPKGNFPFDSLAENPFPGVNYFSPPPPEGTGSPPPPPPPSPPPPNRRRLLSSEGFYGLDLESTGSTVGTVSINTVGGQTENDVSDFYGLNSDGLGQLSDSDNAPDSDDATSPTTNSVSNPADSINADDDYDFYGIYGVWWYEQQALLAAQGLGAETGPDESSPAVSSPPPSPPPPPSFPPPPPFVPTAGSCRFLYSIDYTPIVSSASPSPVTSSDSLVISGSNFASSLDPSSVTVHFVPVSSEVPPVTLRYASQVGKDAFELRP